MRAEITYLDNSGFFVQTERRRLVFDYYNDKPARGKSGLDGGVVGPADLAGGDAYVFVSHRHADHFNPVIFGWEAPGLRYILSFDVPAKQGALSVGPDESLRAGDVGVRTLRSTDEGVAFLVEADGLTVYHAGDLNWWHWEGEPDPWNPDMARAYAAEVDKLRGVRVDVAFVPVDLRLGGGLLRGLVRLMETADVGRAIPMHFWGKADKVRAALASPACTAFADRLIMPMERGERYILE
jgi:L-ascorbate metabolism protein UlaG (beta-lactamase superfamily)